MIFRINYETESIVAQAYVYQAFLELKNIWQGLFAD